MPLQIGSVLLVFGGRISVAFHLLCVRVILSSVWVAEWPPFGKELLTRLTICYLCIMTICGFGYFQFLVLRVLNASVPGICILLLL